MSNTVEIKYWSYNQRTGAMRDYTQKQFDKAKKLYKLQEHYSFAECPQENDFRYWCNRDGTISFFEKQERINVRT